MRLLFSLLFLAITATSYAQSGASYNDESLEQVATLSWYTNFKNAKKAAKEENKPMLVYFTGSDWCSPCKRLQTDFFHTSEFINLSQQYVMVKLDIPHRDDIIPIEDKKQNKIDQKKLKVKSFPTLLALDKNGRERNRIERYSFPDPHYYWEFMKENGQIFKL